jgi:hypothetical protein
VLSIDYSGLQVLLLGALQQVLADTGKARDAQATMQLTVAGRIEEIAQAVASLRSGAKAKASSAPSTAPSQSSSGTLLAAEAVTGCSDDDDASLAFLADTGDVEMSSSSSGEEEVGAAASSGGEPLAGQLAGLTEEQAADWLMAKLGEQAGARKMYLVRRNSLEASSVSCRPALMLPALHCAAGWIYAHVWHSLWACKLICDPFTLPLQKFASQLELSELWSIYQETVRAPTELTAAGDRPRSLGGQFIKLAKKHISDADVRCCAVLSCG